MVVWSSVFLLIDPFVSEISIVEVTLILDWLQNSEHVSESIRNIAIINVKNDKETYKILKKQIIFSSYPPKKPPLKPQQHHPHTRKNTFTEYVSSWLKGLKRC